MGIGRIFDNDPQPTLQLFSAQRTESNSGTQSLAFDVTFSGGAATPVTVDYTTVNRTAQAGSDYTATSGTLTFTPGTTPDTQQILVPIVGDLVVELTEDFTVATLLNALGTDYQQFLLGSDTATGTILTTITANVLHSVGL